MDIMDLFKKKERMYDPTWNTALEHISELKRKDAGAFSEFYIYAMGDAHIATRKTHLIDTIPNGFEIYLDLNFCVFNDFICNQGS
jgi:hypothetical protein